MIVNISCLLCFQLVTSCVMYFPEFAGSGFQLPRIPWVALTSFSVPAVLYTFNNNIAIHMQLQMDPTTFQVSIWRKTGRLCICVLGTHNPWLLVVNFFYPIFTNFCFADILDNVRFCLCQ